MARLGDPNNENWQPLLTIGPFGGVDTTTEPYYVAEGIWTDARNLVPDVAYGGFVTAQGRVNAFTTSLPGQCKGLYRFARSGQADVYVAACDNLSTGHSELYYAPYGGTFTKLNTPAPLTLGQQYSFATSLQWLFITNGLDIPLKIDQSLNVTYWGIVAPTTAPTLIAAGSSTMTGVYYYCVTFGNASQESSQGTVSNSITVSGTGVGLTNIPVSTDSQVTQRNIYRQGGGLGQWRLIHTINDNTTTTYVDTLPDNQVTGQVLTVFRDPPQVFKSIITHKERVWGLGTLTDPSIVYYSNYEEPWGFNDETGNLTVGENSFNDIGIGLGTTGSVLAVFKSETLYAVFGDADSNFISSKIADVGFTSLNSIFSAYGISGGLSRQGFYVWDGSSAPQNISDGNFQQSNIKSVISGLTSADFAVATTFVYDRMTCLSLPTLDRTYIYDSRSSQWYILSWSCDQAYFQLNGQYSVIASNIHSVGELDQWFASPQDLGSNVLAYGISKISDSGTINATKTYRYLQMQAPVQNALATYTIITNPGALAYYETQNIDLSTGGPFHQVPLPMTMVGNEVQLKLLVNSPVQVHIQKIAIYGDIKRLNTEPGNG